MSVKKSLQIQIITLAISSFLSVSAHAGPSSDELGSCFIQSTSGRDRDTLVRWIFNLMAVNPRLKDISSSTTKEREENYKSMALLYERLLFVDCRRESLIAIRDDGDAALEQGFRKLGEIAVRELMGDPVVQNEANGLEKYFDMNKWNALSAESKK
jgi:hypothetical protein